MLTRNPPSQSEITSAPPQTSTNTYPPDKKGADISRAEQGVPAADADGDADEMDSTFGPGLKRRDGVVVDAVWGEIKEGGPNYRNLGWSVSITSTITPLLLALPYVILDPCIGLGVGSRSERRGTSRLTRVKESSLTFVGSELQS